MTKRALHCYLLLSVWILLLIVGAYKFLEPKRLATPIEKIVEPQKPIRDVNTQHRLFKYCNSLDEIIVGEEGIFENRWTLKGILVLIRHGDRGPLQHIRNISSVSCGEVIQNDYLKSYREYLRNITITGKVAWTGPGPFHAFPIIPNSPQCRLGQLTEPGVAQLVKLGRILRQTYGKIWTQLDGLTPGEINVYSTKYRRTFQSGLAFLYGLVPDALSKVTVREGPSMSFCFNECGCPNADVYHGNVKKFVGQLLASHPAVSLLSETVGSLIFSRNSVGEDPFFVRDALLTYVCHGNALPCLNRQNCIRNQDVAGIFSYADWASRQKWSNPNWQRYCLLKAYGLIKHIVSQMLHMVSNNGPYLILYSGHDYTLEQVSTALGLKNEPSRFRYASRIVFEVYYNNKAAQSGASDVYFRILSNGRDVTRSASFCKDLVEVDGATMCKIEDIVRFIHDDYFSALNCTNFKDACAPHDFV